VLLIAREILLSYHPVVCRAHLERKRAHDDFAGQTSGSPERAGTDT
jgi:hypothetical protein